MIKRIFAIFLACLCVLGLSSCKKDEEEIVKPDHEAVEMSEEKEENETEEIVEVIYAKTPEKAADKCLEALYSGNIADAKRYVMPNGAVFKELNDLKTEMINSFGVGDSEKLKKKVEKLIDNTFLQFSYKRTNVEIAGKTARVTYEVSMPDTANINYSLHMDSYMAAKGISQEDLMMSLEGMTEQEAEDWSKEFGIDVMNYIFESGNFARITETTTVTVENTNKGWLVAEIENLAG